MLLSRHELLTLARDIAAYLPEEWNAAESESYTTLQGPDGMEIVLSQHWRGKGEISGILPKGSHTLYIPRADYKKLRIGVTLTRPARALAREITRRLLPNYTVLYHEINERLLSNHAYEEAKTALHARLAANAPRPLQIEPYSPNRVRMSAEVTESQASAIFAALSTLEADGDA